MRVAHVITRLIVGGAQENTLSTVLGLRAMPSLEVFLISGPSEGPEGSLVPQLQNAQGCLFLVPNLVRPVHLWKDFLALASLIRLFRQLKPDVVHTHSGKAGFLGRLAASLTRIPLIVHTIHGPSFGPFQGRIANFAFKTAERIAGRFTDHFISVSQAMTDQYLAAGIGRPSQFSRIFSGFPLSPFLEAAALPSPRTRWNLPDDAFIVGKIARLFPRKGHNHLLRVAAELHQICPRILFLIIGGGTLEESLKRQVQDMGLEKAFHFTGLVPPQQIPEWIACMDLLVHLSEREGLARALPQALAMGKPIVAYDQDGAREVCQTGQTGFLLAPLDDKGLVQAIQTLYHHPQMGKELGKHGQALVLKAFSEKKMVEAIYSCYERELERKTHSDRDPACKDTAYPPSPCT